MSLKFSVIIPVFNAVEYLNECIDSLEDQSFQNFEAIFIDDGSSDLSLDLLHFRAKSNSCFKVFHQDNSGVASARNLALSQAKGEYILFLDSDDWLHAKALQWLSDATEYMDSPDVILFPFISVQPNKQERNRQLDILLAKYGEKPFSFQEAKTDLLYVHGGAGGKLIKRSLIMEQGIRYQEHLSNAEDFVVNLQVYALAKSIAVMNKAVYFYRQPMNGQTLSTGNISKISDSLTYALKNLSVYYPENMLMDRFLQMILYIARRPDYNLDQSSVQVIRRIFVDMQRYPNASLLKNYKNVESFLNKQAPLRSWLRKIVHKERIQGKRRFVVLGYVISSKNLKQLFKRKPSTIDFDDRYDGHIIRIKNKLTKGNKIKVAFLISELAKIKTTSLIEELLISDVFEPYVLIITLRGIPYNTQRPVLDAVATWCEEHNVMYVRAYDIDSGTAFESERFDFDILFYQAPWSLHGSYSVARISQRALTCYVPYYVPNYGFSAMDCLTFHKSLYRYYVLNEDYKNLYEKELGKRNHQLKSVGHTMLDQYKTPKYSGNREEVIYAPHWSIGEGFEKYSTFLWSGFVLLEFAKSHPEFNWVFKPHPTLKKELLKKSLMSIEDIDNYFDQWRKIGVVNEGQDYLTIFRSSKCLITDCGSFLVEYFPTKKAVINLVSNQAIQPNYALKKILKHYYRVYDTEELLYQLNLLLLKGEDPKKSQREIAVDAFMKNNIDGDNAAKRIVQDLLKSFDVERLCR